MIIIINDHESIFISIKYLVHPPTPSWLHKGHCHDHEWIRIPFRIMSISPPIPEIRLFQICTLNETSWSRSLVWSKGKVMLSAQYLIDSLPFHFTSIRPTIPKAIAHLFIEAVHEIPDISPHLLEEAWLAVQLRLVSFTLLDCLLASLQTRLDVWAFIDMSTMDAVHWIQPAEIEDHNWCKVQCKHLNHLVAILIK